MVGTTEMADSFTLMKRDGTGSTGVTNLVCQTVFSKNGHIIEGDGAYFYMPVGADDNMRTYEDYTSTVQPAIYRFGRGPVNLDMNDDDFGKIVLGDFGGHEDGLYMQDDEHIVEIKASSERPTIDIQGTKGNIGDGLLPYIRIRKKTGETVFEVDEHSMSVDTVLCDIITSRSGGALDSINVQTIIAGNQSVWLGNKLHVTEDGSAQLRMRKDTIPKYLTTLSPAVVTADLSTDIEDVPLFTQCC